MNHANQRLLPVFVFLYTFLSKFPARGLTRRRAPGHIGGFDTGPGGAGLGALVARADGVLPPGRAAALFE